jgi:hypothetical protein
MRSRAPRSKHFRPKCLQNRSRLVLSGSQPFTMNNPSRSLEVRSNGDKTAGKEIPNEPVGNSCIDPAVLGGIVPYHPNLSGPITSHAEYVKLFRKNIDYFSLHGVEEPACFKTWGSEVCLRRWYKHREVCITPWDYEEGKEPMDWGNRITGFLQHKARRLDWRGKLDK